MHEIEQDQIDLSRAAISYSMMSVYPMCYIYNLNGIGKRYSILDNQPNWISGSLW